MIKSASLGFSRLGKNLEYKTAISAFINKEIDENQLYYIGSKIRKYNLDLHKEANIDIIPSNDFSWCDHILDTSVMLGNIPKRYYWEGGIIPMEIYFATLLGHKKDKFEVPAMQIAPFFNTRYSYIVPEFQDFTDFVYSDNKPVQHYIEAKQNNILTRIVLFGPISYLLLGKIRGEDIDGFDKFDVIDDILAVYEELFLNLKRIGVGQVQIDEPCLSTDLSKSNQIFYTQVYDKIMKFASDFHVTLTTGFGDIGNNAEFVFSLPVHSIHLDLTNGKNSMEDWIKYSKNKELSLGLVDGLNVFINDINDSVRIASEIINKTDKDIQISTSCSLLHCPIDSDLEIEIDSDKRKYLAYGRQKLKEVSLIKDILNGDKIAKDFGEKISNNYKDLSVFSKKNDKNKLHQYERKSKSNRITQQKKNFKLPNFPLCSLGGMPDFKSLNKAKKQKQSVLTSDEIKDKINDSVKKQELYGFDIISNGEHERHSRYVDYFSSKFNGDIIKTSYAYVQSYASEVKNCNIFLGNFDIEKKEIKEILEFVVYAKLISKKPLKFTIFGPLTFMNESFLSPFLEKDSFLFNVSSLINKIILSANSEDIKIIQINEYCVKESLPIKLTEYTKEICDFGKFIKNCYYNVTSEVQIQMHILNSDISYYVDDLEFLDLDVLFIEGFRSSFDVINEFSGHKYQRDIGIGIQDPKSIYTPSSVEIYNSIKNIIRSFDIEKIWIVQDSAIGIYCQENIIQALSNIRDAVKEIRSKFKIDEED